MSCLKVIKRTETLADQAFNSLKEAITTGKLKAGETLPEEKVGNDLGVSRTPLRDALSRLAMEGLVIHEQGKPAIVAGFSKEDSLEYMELRSILEVENIQKIITKIDKPFIKLLRGNLSEQLVAIEEDNYQLFIELDRAFHLLLLKPNKNSQFHDILHRMNTGVNRAFLILSSTVPQSAQGAYEEHVEIVDALEDKNVIRAKNNMVIHMNNIEKRFLSYYKESEKNS